MGGECDYSSISYGRLVFKHVQTAKRRRSFVSMVFGVQGPTCGSVSGGLFNISEWPEGGILTLTSYPLLQLQRISAGGGGISTEKGKENDGTDLVQRSADRGESLQWNVASSANGMVWHTFSPIKQKRGSLKVLILSARVWGGRGRLLLSPMYVCLWLCHIIGMGTKTGRSPIIARLGSCSCRLLFQAYFIATRDGKETQNKMSTLVIKGTVSRDFLLQVFFMNHLPSSP